MRRTRTFKPPPEMAVATISEADGARYLHLGTPWVQGAMRLGKPHVLELEYVVRMMAWMLLRPEAELIHGHALQLGLGAGAITRFCYRNLGLRTTVVELNSTVIQACRMWFHLPADDDRLTVVQANAAEYVADAANADSVHALQVDLYDHDAAAPVLDDDDFYAQCHRMLCVGGVMSVNLFGRDASFERSARRIASVFGQHRVRSLQPTKEGNTVVLAIKEIDFPDASVLARRSENIETEFQLPAKKWLRMIRQLPVFNDAS